MLINENLEEVLQSRDINNGFNIFSSTFLCNCETCFPMQNVNETKNNQWTTAGIEVSCTHKKSLCILSKTTNSPIIEAYYIQISITKSN